jgi:hypothetical protein
MNGGAVDIVVHERATDQPKPWGYKAFRVVLSEGVGIDGTPGGGGTTIAVENSRMPVAEAQLMTSEVHQWAAGTEGCGAEAPQVAAPAETKRPVEPSRPSARMAPTKVQPAAGPAAK